MPKWMAKVRELWEVARPARHKAEDDVQADPNVSEAPAQRDDGGYAGRTGAEARGQG